MVQKTPTPIDSARKAPHSVSINALTENVLNRYSRLIESKQIRVEKELQRLTATVHPKFIDSAVCDLIENAIATTPRGGELNITLMDGENCWELEVADSSIRTKTCKLGSARFAADMHGGMVESLACPQGGMANILVIPQRQPSKRQHEH